MFHPSYSFLRELIFTDKKKTSLRIIDYGCGNGLAIELIGAEHINKYTGFEISEEALIKAGKTYQKVSSYIFQKIDRDHLPSFGKKNSIDLVILIGVLQYLSTDEIQHVLKESKRVLTKSGRVVISCAADHKVYKWLNIYQVFVPHSYVNRENFLSLSADYGLKPVTVTEKGLLFAPFISHCVTIFFDVIDRFVLGKSGSIGPFGTAIRDLTLPLIWLEYKIPVDFGYTLFLTLKK